MKKKYKFKINIEPDSDLIIPEYKIRLFNKNKKLVNKVEYYKTIKEINKNFSGKKNSLNVNKVKKKNEDYLSKKINKKSSDVLGKVLWTRRRSKSN